MLNLRRISLLGLFVAAAATLTAEPAVAGDDCSEVTASNGEICTVCKVTCLPGGEEGTLFVCETQSGDTCPVPE